MDVAWLDGTFYGPGEVLRDMSEIPHPFIVESMKRFAPLPADQRAKVRFVHFNHSNPAMSGQGEASDAVRAKGFGLAREGDRVLLR